MGQYANELYARNYSLECENKALRGQIEEFKNGQRYKKLAEGYGKPESVKFIYGKAG